VLGVADLGEEDGAGQLGHGVTETDEEATAKVHWEGVLRPCHRAEPSREGILTSFAGAEGGEESTQDHDETANEDGHLAAKVIAQVGAGNKSAQSLVKHVDG
jgi:hypothetical protein